MGIIMADQMIFVQSLCRLTIRIDFIPFTVPLYTYLFQPGKETFIRPYHSESADHLSYSHHVLPNVYEPFIADPKNTILFLFPKMEKETA